MDAQLDLARAGGDRLGEHKLHLDRLDLVARRRHLEDVLLADGQLQTPLLAEGAAAARVGVALVLLALPLPQLDPDRRRHRQLRRPVAALRQRVHQPHLDDRRRLVDAEVLHDVAALRRDSHRRVGDNKQPRALPEPQLVLLTHVERAGAGELRRRAEAGARAHAARDGDLGGDGVVEGDDDAVGDLDAVAVGLEDDGEVARLALDQHLDELRRLRVDAEVALGAPDQL